ncbi:hypothetical protein DFR67_104370 [Williamsia limnetica]|uniref:Suppressor of fused protein SUFU n=1 Tax=Williamsia limnetica TaxID=882452 RepID=A0A318RL66_WILLI|nr:hypothetical protein [Williamsia limnetica]PYE18788.1 hypothetical protein DFR67_104370 [Williamsia limnetica]
MTYWSNSQGRLMSEPEFIAAIAALLQSAAPPGATGARVAFGFAGTGTRYAVTYFGQVPQYPVQIPPQTLELARDLRVGRYQSGGDACLLMEITVGVGTPVIRFDHGENGPIDQGLIFPADAYRDDLMRYPRRAPAWLVEYVGGTPLAQLTSGSYFPFPPAASVPTHATNGQAAVAIALDFIRVRNLDFTGHNLYSLTAQRIQAGWRVFTQAPVDPARAGGRMRLIFLVADDGVVEMPSSAMTPEANELMFTQRTFERSRLRNQMPSVLTPAQSGPNPEQSGGGVGVATRGPQESTQDVPGAREAQVARDNMWRGVGQMYEQLLPPLADNAELWPGGMRGYRVIRRTRTTLLATDGLSAPSLIGGGTSAAFGPIPGGSILGVGAEFFVETIDPELRADESAREHWLFSVLSAVAAQGAAGGSDFVATITGSPDAVYVELSGVTAPREWLVGNTMGVLLSNKGWGAPSGFDTPLGRVALVSVTVLRASESVTTSAWPAAAGEIFRQLSARRIGHYFDPGRDAIY